MTYSPISAALEGFRVIARRPVSFIGWCLTVAATWLLVGVISMVMTGAIGPAGPGVRMFRPGSGLLANLLMWADLFVGFTIVACAVYRAVLRPEARGLGYLRLSGEELRVMGVSGLLLLFAVIMSFALGLSMTVLSSLLGAIAGRWAAILPSLAFFVALVILGVRLSMAAPIALAEGRHALAASWDLSRGRFWSLLGLWAIVWLVSVLLFLLAAAVTSLVAKNGMFAAAGAPAAGNMAVGVVVSIAGLLLMTLMTVLPAAAAASAYRGLTAKPPTPVEVFD